MKTIRFDGRVPSVMNVKVGNEGDNLAESLRFELPPWLDDAAVSLYLSTGKCSDVILLDADRIYRPTRTHTQHPGRWTAYLEAQQDGDVVWHSDPFSMIVGDLPDTGERIEQAYPTAVEEAMKAAAQTAIDRAEVERLAEQVESDSQVAEIAAQGAQQSATQAEAYKNTAGDSAAQAARDAEQTAQDRAVATAAATSAANDAEKTAADREAADTAAAAAKQSAEQAAADAAQVAQDKREVATKVEAEVSALREAILSGTKENAAYHLGLYRDENGELCELEEGE